MYHIGSETHPCHTHPTPKHLAGIANTSFISSVL